MRRTSALTTAHHIYLEITLGNEALESGIFLLQFAQASHVADLQLAVSLAPRRGKNHTTSDKDYVISLYRTWNSKEADDNASVIAPPAVMVPAFPPISLVRGPPSVRTASMATVAPLWPRWS